MLTCAESQGETTVNDQFLMVKVSYKPVNLIIIQVYFSTSGYNDEDIEEMYDQIEEFVILTSLKINSYCGKF